MELASLTMGKNLDSGARDDIGEPVAVSETLSENENLVKRDGVTGMLDTEIDPEIEEGDACARDVHGSSHEDDARESRAKGTVNLSAAGWSRGLEVLGVGVATAKTPNESGRLIHISD